LSFKYAIAHMYSVSDPVMVKPVLPLLSPQLRAWLTVRNDDIYSFRWADLDYARAFIKAIPSEDKIAGFYMGPDGYIWGRDFLTKDAATPRQTVMQKQWLSFALWGRLAYDPDLSAETFQRLITAHFPGADVPALSAAWADASKTFSLHYKIFLGAMLMRHGFRKVAAIGAAFTLCASSLKARRCPVRVCSTSWSGAPGYLTGNKFNGITPIEIAAALETNASSSLKALPQLQRAVVTPASSAKEYTATLGDIEAMSKLGLYYAGENSRRVRSRAFRQDRQHPPASRRRAAFGIGSGLLEELRCRLYPPVCPACVL